MTLSGRWMTPDWPDETDELKEEGAVDGLEDKSETG